MNFQDKHQTAKQLGVSVHSVIKYIARKKDALPYFKSKSNKVRYEGSFHELPEDLKSSTNQRKLIFVKEQVDDWHKNQF